VLAGAGVTVLMSDLFGAQGHQLLGRVELPTVARARVNSVLRLIENLDFRSTWPCSCRRRPSPHATANPAASSPPQSRGC
jgi:hypothetical protein